MNEPTDTIDDHDPLNPADAVTAADTMMAEIRARDAEVPARPLKDGEALQRLHNKFRDRKSRPQRGDMRCRVRLLRDPRDVAYRYLRRFVGGSWFRGGSHVARYQGGNGIGFLGWANDRNGQIRPILTGGPEGDKQAIAPWPSQKVNRGTIKARKCVRKALEVVAFGGTLKIEGAGSLSDWRGHRRRPGQRFLVTDLASGDFIAWWTTGDMADYDRAMAQVEKGVVA